MRRLLALAWVLASVSPAYGDTELKNDGFVSGGTAVFQTGFAPDEIGAARFVAPEATRRLLKVQLIFGGATTTQPMGLKVWDDSAGTNAPGAELFSADFDLMGSESAMHELSLSSVSLFVPMQFRVGVVFHHTGAPSIAMDQDGNGAADKNFIFANTWNTASSFGVTGDWIIRAIVSDAAGNPGQSSCAADTECPLGEFCDTVTQVCTFECRTSADCNGEMCSSRGRCPMAAGEDPATDTGCCQTGSGSASGVLLALGVLGLVLRRRTSRCRDRAGSTTSN